MYSLYCWLDVQEFSITLYYSRMIYNPIPSYLFQLKRPHRFTPYFTGAIVRRVGSRYKVNPSPFLFLFLYCIGWWLVQMNPCSIPCNSLSSTVQWLLSVHFLSGQTHDQILCISYPNHHSHPDGLHNNQSSNRNKTIWSGDDVIRSVLE